MSSPQHKSASSFGRGPLVGRIAGAALAGALFLGAPLLGSLIVEPAVAVADDGDIHLPDLSWLDHCAKPIDPNDCDRDGLSNRDETYRWHTNVVFSDTDGDGFNDPTEIYVGTNPNNANSVPKNDPAPSHTSNSRPPFGIDFPLGF